MIAGPCVIESEEHVHRMARGIRQAVGEFVEREYASLVAVREGEADIEAGRSIEGDAVRAWFEDLKSGRTQEAPAAGKRRRK